MYLRREWKEGQHLPPRRGYCWHWCAQFLLAMTQEQWYFSHGPVAENLGSARHLVRLVQKYATEWFLRWFWSASENVTCFFCRGIAFLRKLGIEFGWLTVFAWQGYKCHGCGGWRGKASDRSHFCQYSAIQLINEYHIIYYKFKTCFRNFSCKKFLHKISF